MTKYEFAESTIISLDIRNKNYSWESESRDTCSAIYVVTIDEIVVSLLTYSHSRRLFYSTLAPFSLTFRPRLFPQK